MLSHQLQLILRKQVSSSPACSIAPQLSDYFLLFQHSVGISGGAENVVQGLRLLSLELIFRIKESPSCFAL